VESLEREKRNVKDRERRAKSTVRDVLEDLKGKNLINEDLKERLNFYSGKKKQLCITYVYTFPLLLLLLFPILCKNTY